MTDEDSVARCNHCKQPLIEIDNRSERLRGCLTCNLWAAGGSKGWKRLSEEDPAHSINCVTAEGEQPTFRTVPNNARKRGATADFYFYPVE